MNRRPKKYARQKDMTDELLSEGLDVDRVEKRQRFTQRSKHAQQDKIVRTALMRAEEQAAQIDPETLPVGIVIQVFSVYYEVEHEGVKFLCVVRKTLGKVMDTHLVVGDLVRFRTVEDTDDEAGSPQGVIEQILPRKTVLTRADSFKAIESHPIVANAEQMLIVVSLHQPEVKWGLVDRMIVAAQSGGLRPIVCLNKVDLSEREPKDVDEDSVFAEQVLRHYESLGVSTIRTSVVRNLGLLQLREALTGRNTVLAGHSGVGKSSLIHAIEPALDLRIGEISRYTNKGRHTTTFARRYPLEAGGYVIDTPGVKLFGLWGVTRENLDQYFPDIADGAGPEWRRASYERIVQSLSK